MGFSVDVARFTVADCIFVLSISCFYGLDGSAPILSKTDTAVYEETVGVGVFTTDFDERYCLIDPPRSHAYYDFSVSSEVIEVLVRVGVFIRGFLTAGVFNAVFTHF